MTDDIVEVTRSDVMQTVIAAGIIGIAFVAAGLIAALVRWVIPRVTPYIDRDLLDPLVRAIRGPIIWLVFIQGFFLGIRYPDYVERYLELIDRIWLGAVVVIVVLMITRIVSQIFTWYQAHPEFASSRVDPRTLPMLRRAANVVVWVLGGLVFLDVIGLEITPLIAGLGIGGLAVALALQPLLANVFASSYMLSDASIRVGDYVGVEAGPMGVVEHVGWRATRIRSFDNNIVMIPNAKLADSTFTNYTATDQKSDARLTFNVAIEEDLTRVEELVREELIAIRDELEETVKDYDPVVLFQEFGESNISVMVKLRAVTWGDSFTMRHMMVKRVHSRLRDEGIDINFPARRLLLQGEDLPGLDWVRSIASELSDGRRLD